MRPSSAAIIEFRPSLEKKKSLREGLVPSFLPLVAPLVLTSELAVKAGDDLADGLGGTSAGGDDVSAGRATTTPVLGGGAVDGLLGGSGSVDGGHETLKEAELVVDDLGEGSQALGKGKICLTQNSARMLTADFVVGAREKRWKLTLVVQLALETTWTLGS